MQPIRKLIFWTSLIFILILIIAITLLRALPIEFAFNKDEYHFDNICFFGLPIAILLTLTGTLKHKDPKAIVIGKIFLTIVIACLPILIAFSIALGGMCTWTTDKTLYENKNDKTSKIVLRDFGCGATDSGSPIRGTFKIKYYTSHLIYVSDIDTNKIDKIIWMRVKSENE